MVAHVGSTIKIKKAGVVICSGINQKDISFNTSLIDISAGSNRGYRVLMEDTDTKSLDVSFKGIAKDRTLRKMRLNDANFLNGITIEFGNGDTVTGNFMMNGYAESGALKDAVQFSCDFQSTGKYSHTFSSSEGDDGSTGGGGGVPSYPPAETGLLNGVLKVIGHNLSSGNYVDMTSEGDALPAMAPVYDFDAAEVEAIYQRPRIFKNGTQLDNFGTCAISGAYAISCELGFNEARYVAITRYRKDTGADDDSTGAVRGWSGWSVGDSVSDGSSINLIDCGENYSPIDIVMIEKNKFIIVTKSNIFNYDEAPTAIKIMFVTFENSLDWVVSECVVDLVALGMEGRFINPGEFEQSMRVAFNYLLPNKITISYIYATPEGNQFFTVFYYQDSNTFEKVDDQSMPLYSIFVSEGEVTESHFYLDRTSYYYKYATGSYGNRLLLAYTTYGYEFNHTTYDHRELVDEDGVTPLNYVNYIDQAIPATNVIAAVAMAPKLNEIGLPSSNPDFFPYWGAAGLMLT